MKRTHLVGAVLTMMAMMSLVAFLVEGRQLPHPTVVRTQTGFILEQVEVGQSCLVLVHRGQGPSDPIAVVPCD